MSHEELARLLRDKETEKRDGCALAVVLFVMLPFAIAWWGFCGSCLWNWFVAATFSLPTLSVPVAAGLMAFVTLLKIPAQSSSKKKQDETVYELFGKALGQCFIGPGLSLLIGYIALQFA